MASVIMDRGNTSKMNNIPATNGMIYFNTDDKCIYLDDGVNRTIFGGQIQRITNIDLADDNNVFTAKAVVDNFIQTNNVADNVNNINTNVQPNRPVGCNGFKAIIGTSDISNIDSTVKGSVIKLDNRLKINNSTFYFDYQNGIWGFNTSEQRGADTFHPFNSTQVRYINNIDYAYVSSPIVQAHNIGIKIKDTVSTNAGRTSFVMPYCTSAVTYGSCVNSQQIFDGYNGDVIHIFLDGVGSGHIDSATYNNKHYIFSKDSTYTECSQLSPLAEYKASATIGMPFTIKKLKPMSGGSGYYRDDELYYYLCYNNYIKIYKYVVNPSSLYKNGDWVEQQSAQFELAPESSGITRYQMGDKNNVVVYRNELYLIGGSYQQDGYMHEDKRILVWNPQTQIWRILDGVPHDSDTGLTIDDKQYWLVSNDKLCGISIASGSYTGSTLITYDGISWNAKDIGVLGITTNRQGSCVDYNGDVHYLENKTHIAFNINQDDIASTVRTYAALAYPFKYGCACAVIPYTLIHQPSSSSGTSLVAPMPTDATEQYVDSLPKVIHYFSTIDSSNSNAYQKYHQTLQDIYYVGVQDNLDNIIIEE